MKTHPKNKKKTLLLVEDNSIVRELLQDILETSYNVIQAVSGEEALAICSSISPDMVILDDGLPGITGEEVAQQLSNCLNIPFIVLTAHSDRKKTDRYISIGASAYLVKPISPANLLAGLKAAFNNSRNISNLLLKSSRDHYIGRAIASLMLLDGHNEQGALNALKSIARNERKKLWLKAKEMFEARLLQIRTS